MNYRLQGIAFELDVLRYFHSISYRYRSSCQQMASLPSFKPFSLVQTGQSGDQGIDLAGTLFGSISVTAQCKKLSNARVPVSSVREFIGALPTYYDSENGKAKQKIGFFASVSGYSKDAVNLAKTSDSSIALLDFSYQEEGATRELSLKSFCTSSGLRSSLKDIKFVETPSRYTSPGSALTINSISCLYQGKCMFLFK